MKRKETNKAHINKMNRNNLNEIKDKKNNNINKTK